MNEGRLHYLVGASGVGKDTLLRYARARIGDGAPIVFAHRYITRPADARGENHVALSEQEFDLRKRHGAFAMDWASHGYRYGIGREIHYWLATGLSVVVNGSRGYAAEALIAYPDLHVIWVTASTELVAERLAKRGREDGQQIAERLQRHPASAVPLRARGSIVHLNNDGPLALAGDALVSLLTGTACFGSGATAASGAARRS